jgi:hypothetical protein
VEFLKHFAAFWYDFVVGDDWLIAIGALAALVVVAVLARSQWDDLAWIFLPLAVAAVLCASLRRAVAQD